MSAFVDPSAAGGLASATSAAALSFAVFGALLVLVIERGAAAGAAITGHSRLGRFLDVAIAPLATVGVLIVAVQMSRALG